MRARLETYLEPDQVNAILAAYDYAHAAHAGQVRRSGHAYITHPLAVADILAEMRLDPQTIMAALLHDVVEDTSTDVDTVRDRFGESVATLVDGVSKLGTIFNSRAEAQAENFQKMVLAMARDIRVILVKFADRLHNMRTLHHLPIEKRKRIARETLEFYAPIAHRLGMREFKVQFEDLAFRTLYPMRAERIERAVGTGNRNRKRLMSEIETALNARLAEEGIEARVQSREKHLYSIYSKMKTQRKSFARIMDVFGVRIITDTPDNCYRILGLVHGLYKPVNARFKDYIAIPKANGYQALHTTLFGLHGVHIEIQIRTEDMDAVANHGIAGHWRYKHSRGSTPAPRERTEEWVRNILELQERAGSSLEFIEHLKVDLFPDEVYVFTPEGDIMQLPRGACPIDFAYAVHTDIGNRCVACRVNRSLRPLSTELSSGETVQILTSRGARPKPEWLGFAVTGKARSAIRQALKNQQKSESVALGRRLLNRALGEDGLTIKDFDFRRLRRVFREFGVRRLDDLLAEIGLGNRLAYVVARRLIEAGDPDAAPMALAHKGPVAIRGGEGLVISYAKCCRPIPGDAIAGYISSGKGLVVHIETCPNMAEIRRRNPGEIIPVRWDDRIDEDFVTDLKMDVTQHKGVIAELATVLSATDAGIEKLNMGEHSAELSTVHATLHVRDRQHLARVLRRLRAQPYVTSITRSLG